MSAKIISGNEVSQQLKDEMKEEVVKLKAQGMEPCLAVILVGEDPASKVYVLNKKKACEYIGIKSLETRLPATTTRLLSAMTGALAMAFTSFDRPASIGNSVKRTPRACIT